MEKTLKNNWPEEWGWKAWDGMSSEFSFPFLVWKTYSQYSASISIFPLRENDPGVLGAANKFFIDYGYNM